MITNYGVTLYFTVETETPEKAVTLFRERVAATETAAYYVEWNTDDGLGRGRWAAPENGDPS